MRRAANYFFFGNAFIALGAACLVGTTSLLIRAPFPWYLAGWVFLATFFLYNFDSLLPVKLLRHTRVSPRKAWVLSHRRPLALVVILAGLAVLVLFFRYFELHLFWFLAHLAIISMFYSLPVIPGRGTWIPLRNIPLLKLLLIAYVWASVTVWLPLLAAGWNIQAGEGWTLFIQRFLFILPLTIVFDIRDVERDESTATLTLPRLVGVKRAKFIALLILLLYLVVVGFTQTGANQVALLIGGLCYGAVLAFARPGRDEYFYAVIADGVLVLPLVLVWALNQLAAGG